MSELVDPRKLESIGNLRLLARNVVEGTLTGMHRNPHRGSSVEFAEYKEYAPGDDVKHIDWRAYGRIDRYYVKQFEDETNLRAFMLVDSSGSMGFGTENAPTKLRWASILAASFSWLLLGQGDAPGLLTFRDKPETWLPPSSKRTQLDDIVTVLDALRPGGTTAVSAALWRIAERVHTRCMVAVISDFLGDPEDLLRLARVLRQKGLEVVFFHVIDRAEQELPYEGLTLFEGLEGEDDLLVDPDDLREDYRKRFVEHLEFIEASCRAGDIEYFRAFTDEPVQNALLALLTRRRVARGRRGR